MWIAQTPVKIPDFCCFEIDDRDYHFRKTVGVLGYRCMISILLLVPLDIFMDIVLTVFVYFFLGMFGASCCRDDIEYVNMTMEGTVYNLVFAGTIEEVEDLTLFGANIELDDDILNGSLNGKTKALILVPAEQGDIESLKWLLQQGAHMDGRMLTAASQYHRAKCVDFLLCQPNNYSYKQLILDVDDQTSEEKETPLMAAMKNVPQKRKFDEQAFRDTITILIDKYNADLNLQDVNGRTALLVGLQTTKDTNMEIVSEKIKLLLSAGTGNISVNIQDNTGTTAAIYCIRQGLIDVVKILEDQGADITLADNEGKTAVTYAAEKGLLKMLSDQGVDLKLTDKHGLKLNEVVQQCPLQTVEYLLDEKIVDIDEKDDATGETALMGTMNSTHLWDSAITSNNITETLSLLLKRKADVNATNNNGYTALMLGVSGTLWGLGAFLSEATDKIDFNVQNNCGDTAFMMCAALGSVDEMKLFLSNAFDKIDWNLRNNDGDTALMLCVASGNVDSVKLLLSKASDQIDFNVKNNHGDSVVMQVIHVHVTWYAVDILHLLRQYNVIVPVREVNVLLLRSAMRDFRAAGPKLYEYLLSERLTDIDIDVTDMMNGTDINIKALKLLLSKVGDTINYRSGYSRTTSVMDVIKVSISDDAIFIEILELLRQYNGDFSARDRDGKTALLYAAECTKLKTMKYLLSNKLSNVNESDKNGETSLMLLMQTHNYLGRIEKAFDILLNQFNADPNKTRNDGKTALMVGVYERQVGYVECFISVCGDSIDYSMKDEDGQTALDIATKLCSTNFVKLLKEKQGIIDHDSK